MGLAGTGDKDTEFTSASLGGLIKGLGADIKSDRLDTKNSAAVLVTAVLPPFTKVGTPIDIILSSVGTASSLDGGMLMAAPLKGADGKVYAMAQGRVSEGGKGKKGGSDNKVTAMITSGAVMEKELKMDWSSLKELTYLIRDPDFTTAARMAITINRALAGKYASALDAGTIEVIVPYSFEGNPVDLVAFIESLDVESDRAAKVVINGKTGTVILGKEVKVLPVAIAHGSLKIQIQKPASTTISEPIKKAAEPLNAPVVAKNELAPEKAEPKQPVEAQSGDQKIHWLDGSTSVMDLVSGLNEMGAGAEELTAILQNLKASGALLGELEIR